jgi:hypothetical protein
VLRLCPDTVAGGKLPPGVTRERFEKHYPR